MNTLHLKVVVFCLCQHMSYKRKNKVKMVSVTMSKIEWETTIRRIVTGWTWNPSSFSKQCVLSFFKSSPVHTPSFPSEEISSSSMKLRGEGWHCVSIARGAGGCRLGYGDMVWRVRVNRGKGVMLHNLPNSPKCKFASKEIQVYPEIIEEEGAGGVEGWKWEEWNILHGICKPNGVKDYQMKPSYKMRP